MGDRFAETLLSIPPWPRSIQNNYKTLMIIHVIPDFGIIDFCHLE